MFKEFEKLEDRIIGIKNLYMKKILLETFKFGDLLTYDKIKRCPEDFANFATNLAQDQRALNLGWIDLVIMYEWQLELDTVREEQLFSESTVGYFDSFCYRNRYNFDVRQVADSVRAYL